MQVAVRGIFKQAIEEALKLMVILQVVHRVAESLNLDEQPHKTEPKNNSAKIEDKSFPRQAIALTYFRFHLDSIRTPDLT